MELFQGSDLAFGRSELTNNVSQKGKHETKSWTEKRAITEEDWRRHVEGTASVGIPPINSESMVRFGAIDIDQYQGLSLDDLAVDISESGLPLVLCRSKSGGPHIYLFCREWVNAATMVEKLDMVAGYFGFGAAEIFPKQVSIGNHRDHPDYGNWINMPYFNGMKNFRYGISPRGVPIKDIKEFCNYAKEQSISPEDLNNLSLPQINEENETFTQGPPCLKHIFAKNKAGEGQRNILLCNITVYAKNAHPDNWKDKIDEYNRLFPQPLPNREVEAIKRSYASKEYRYQCSQSPLCDFCNSQVCKNKLHGIETGEILPNNRSLTVINTSPPIWYLDITAGEAETTRISLSTDELQNPRLFQKRCMEVIKTMPPVPKQEEWGKLVQNLLKHVTQINVPKELSPTGQLLELLETFIVDKGSTDTPEVLLRGLVYCSPEEYWFRWIDLKDFLNRHRFDLLKQNQILATLKTECKMNKNYQKIAGRGVQIQTIRRTDLQIVEPEALTVKQNEDPF
jgi:hypothetical protein